MGESAHVDVNIGGKTTARVDGKLRELLAETFGGAAEIIGTGFACAGTLHAGGKRNYGNADEVEEFCKKHGLPYVLTWSGSSFGAGTHAWRPGMAVRAELDADEDGEPAFTLRDLKSRLAAGKTLADLIAELTVGDASTLPPFGVAEFNNNHDADAEGWGIFETNGSENGPFQICRVDDADVLQDDLAAWRFVVAKAGEGSAYHRDALDFIRANAPAEWCSFGGVHCEPLQYPGGEPMLDADGYLIDVDGEQVDAYGEPIEESDDPHAKPLRFNPAGGPANKEA